MKSKVIAARGYVFIPAPNHPKANKSGYVAEHILMCERVMGRLLPDRVEVHHIDENKQNNINTNFVICQDRSYHMLLHQRTRAFDACGNAEYRKCHFCGKYSDPIEMRLTSRTSYVHPVCVREYANIYYRENSEKWGVQHHA